MLSRISLLAAALLLVACESGSERQPASPGSQPADATALSNETVRPAETARPAPGKESLTSGELDIGISDTSVIIRANAVSQQTILYRLATQAGFEITEADVPWDVMTLNIEADNLHAALLELLRQHPYQIIYQHDAGHREDTLARVVVGAPPTGYEGMPVTTETTLHPEEQEYLAQLLDPSPEIREDAAGMIEPVGIALEYLATLVTTDPSPEVRIAAVGTLADSKDPKALEALFLALQDDHPEVLVEVINALGDYGNRLAIPQLQPFLEHPDEDVRDAAEDALDSLE